MHPGPPRRFKLSRRAPGADPDLLPQRKITMKRCCVSSSLLLALSLLFALVVAGGAAAATWVVPDQAATIQAAIDGAADGDTVLVRPGVYTENLLVAGRPLTLASIGGAEATVIDGRNPTRPDTQSVVTAIGVTGFILEGFTIRGGSGGSTLGQGSEVRSGGGLSIFASDGVVKDCIITDNQCEMRGGGVYLYTSTAFVIEGSTITGNRSLAGGGISAENGSPRIVDSTVSDNRSTSGSGIHLFFSSATIERVLIADNRNDSGASGFGGGIFATRGSPEIVSSTVVGNENDVGGGLYFWLAPMPAVRRTIVAFNLRGSAIACNASTPALECCDLFANAGGDELCGTDLGGNFSLDPLLCADYSLAEGSPCTPGQSPGGCGLVGARDVGCGTALVPTTWGRVKNAYRAR
jgi:hypothetical protein